MDWNLSEPGRVSARQWLAWGLLLVLVYVTLTAIFWHRMFIDTEAWALAIAAQPFAQQIEQIRGDLVHPPLMYLLQRGWLAAFGHTDNAAHALPVPIVSAAILLLTLLATRITAHWRLLSFFLATLFYQVGTAPVTVRMYGLVLLLVTAALLLWDNWRANPRTATLAAWTGVLTLLVYTHLSGLLFLFAFVVLNWLHGQRKLAFTWAAAIPGIAFLPWLLYVLPVYSSRGLGDNLNWVHQKLLNAIPALFFNFLGALQTDSYRRTFLAMAISALIHLGLLILLWINRARFLPLRSGAPASQRWFWIAALLSALPLAVLLGFSIVVSRAFEARFVLGAAIPYSIALFLLCQLSGRAGRIALIFVLLPWKFVAIGSSMAFVSRPALVRESVEFVAAHARAGDLLLTDNPNHSGAIYWEWFRRLGRSERMEALPPRTSEALRVAVLSPISVERLNLTGIERIWVFQSGPEEREGLADALAARGFVRAPQRIAGDSQLILYERKVTTEN